MPALRWWEQAGLEAELGRFSKPLLKLRYSPQLSTEPDFPDGYKIGINPGIARA